MHQTSLCVCVGGGSGVSPKYINKQDGYRVQQEMGML